MSQRKGLFTTKIQVFFPTKCSLLVPTVGTLKQKQNHKTWAKINPYGQQFLIEYGELVFHYILKIKQAHPAGWGGAQAWMPRKHQTEITPKPG